ncbi:MAG: rRNA maturation RNase YbeY [Draconibacterium sp.]|nr:rRNA maturation RNase YbeY [Draconibacterium sp.]
MNSIDFFFEDVKPLSLNLNHINIHIKKLISNELKEIGDITAIFCSDKYLLEMNKQYLNHDYYTDIITFDYVEKNIISGDLFISVERIKDNAKQFDIELIKEVYRVVFHGVLHLVGFNDKTDEEQELMTEKENFYLSEVDFSGIEL